MRPYILIALAGILTLASSALQAADVKPIVVNPSTGLNTTIQPGMRLSVPTASGGFLVTLDPGVQTGTQVFTFPIVAAGQTIAILGAQTFTGEQTLPASTTGAAPLNIPQGTAPTSPVNGDVWTTVAGLFARINGATVGPFAASTGSSFPVSTSTYAVQDASDATKQQKWNLASSSAGTILTLKGQQSTSQTLAFPNVTGSDTLATLGLANVFTAKNTFPATTTSAASINLPAGTAPTSPVDGDVWTTTAGVFARINGGTVGPFNAGGITGSLTSGQVPVATGTTSIGNSKIADSGTLTTIAETAVVDIGTGSAVVAVATPGFALLGNAGAPTYLDAYGYAGSVSTLRTYKAAGTRSAPTTISGSSQIGGWSAGGYIGSSTNDFRTTAEWSAVSTATGWTSTTSGTDMRLRLCPDGSASMNPVLYIKQSGNVLIGPSNTDVAGVNGLSVAGETYTAASTTANAGLNVPPGTAPTAPANGDFWSTAAGFFGRVNGSTVGPFAAAGSGFPVSTTTYAVQDSGDATKQQLWNLASMTAGTNLTLKGNQSTTQTVNIPNVTTTDTLAALGLGNAFTGSNTFGTSTTPLFITAGAASSVTPPTQFSYIGGAHTALTAGSAGLPEFLIDLSQTKQWTGTTTVSGYKAMQIKAPVLSSTTATTTFIGATTLSISGPPTSGTNASMSSPLALEVASGAFQVTAGTTFLKGAANLFNAVQTAVGASAGIGFSWTGAANTNQTAGANLTQFLLNFGQTYQHATGSVALNQTVLINAPTLSAVGASTITTADTFAINAAPAAGTNATITTANALHVMAGQTELDGNLNLASIGSKILIKEGTNASLGVATLASGTVTVSNSLVTANSRIMLSIQSLGTVSLPTVVGVTARSAGTSFTITSASVTDTSVVAWQIIEPAP